MPKQVASVLDSVKKVGAALVMRSAVGTICQLAGLAAVSAGGFSYDATWGFLLGGFGLLAFGVAVERG